MAKLAAKAYLIASLNVMVAARQHSNPDQAFTNDEIVEILMTMAENEAFAINTRASRSHYWQYTNSRELV